jgi:hypothetical protein
MPPVITKEVEVEAKRLYVLTLEHCDKLAFRPDDTFLIGIFASIPLLAKTARNFNPKFPLDHKYKMYVTQSHQDISYGELIALNKFTWEEFKENEEIKSALRRGQAHTYYTDYPFTELGDIATERAPIRPIDVISYDYDKYVKVRVEGIISEIKSGYIYTEEGRYGNVTKISRADLNILPKTKS